METNTKPPDGCRGALVLSNDFIVLV